MGDAAASGLTVLQSAAAAAKAAEAAKLAPGIDDWSSKPSPEHPRPVVLVHGTYGTAYNYWLVMAPLLAASGYSVFRLDYGAMPGILGIHGIAPLEQSAQELAEFVDRVLAATGADKVDIVGHSQGGMLPRHYIKFLGGAEKVHHLIGISPSNHGTTMHGLAEIAKQFPGAEELVGAVTPACLDQISTSEFLRRLNEDGETTPGVNYTVIATRYDEVVTPYTSCWLAEGPQVTNVLVQDSAPTDLSGHGLIVYSPTATRAVLTALAAKDRVGGA
ncbi:esterase/lipase family protein [Streptomyces monticola]